MRVFQKPFIPDKPKVPSVEEDMTAEQKAQEEAQRKARAAAAGMGRQSSLLAGSSNPQGRQRSLLGFN